ncbi:hypothetical protein NPX13_g695 [Xylaria arbuscula]|uniref:Uncharacterized protein n=1 Tax=Xylaria arbuscula TaxID=114810 RepID=A0A9W8TSC1_9PEZI|nr:hypothetical protein NPX13_g695 [Xylaria arbuscula]
MSDFAITLAEEGDAHSALRAKNLEGEDFRDVLINQGNNGPKFIARAEIVGLASGHLRENGPLATMIVFRFYFVNLETNPSRRFVSAKIKVEFSDVRSRGNMDPEVIAISPEGEVHLDMTKREIDDEKSIHASIAKFVDFGFEWKVAQKREKEYYVKQLGIKFNSRTTFTGSDNMAIWQLVEHTGKKKGIPSFLQTAVLLQRRGDDKVVMKIGIETETDALSTMKAARKRLFGGATTEPVDPVHISPKMFRIRNLHGAEELQEGSSALMSMETIDMGRFTGVELLLVEQQNQQQAIQ